MRPVRSWLAPVRRLVAGAAVLLVPGVAGAQADSVSQRGSLAPGTVTIDGVVNDLAGRPILAAEVIAGSHHAVSNRAGRFILPGLAPGDIELYIRRIGYSPTTATLRADPGLTVSLAIKLAPVAVQLGTIVVEGRRMDRRLWQLGFYARADKGFGKYMSPEYLAIRPRQVSSLLQEVAGLRVERDRRGAHVLGRSGFGYCPLNVFVDGVRISWVNEVGLDNVIGRDDIAAIEVYPRASEVPGVITGPGGRQGMSAIGLSQIGRMELTGTARGECGAVLIWTRPIEPRTSRR